MIDKYLIEKINEIFVRFEKINAKIWNIDTDVFNTWKIFIENLNNNFIYEDFIYNKLVIETIPHPNSKKKNESYYFIKINNIDVTPTKKNKEKGWAKSTLRQFLQEGSAFGIIIYSPGDKLINESSFHISSKIANLINNFRWEFLILSTIKNSIFSQAPHIRNFGLSMFYAYVINKDENILYEMSTVVEFKWARTKAKNKAFHSRNLQAKENGRKIYQQTYKGLVKYLNSIFNFDFVINDLFETIVGIPIEYNTEDYLISEKEFIYEPFTNREKMEDYNKNINSAKRLLDSERGKLRNELILYRAKNKKRYCDIELDDEPFLENTEAAHIFPISEIKQQIIYQLKNDPYIGEEFIACLIKQASNKNNGLLLPNSIHKEFDRNTFQFDIKGNIIFQKENFEKMQSLKIVNSKIKKEVLNDEMIDFLKKRIN